MPAKRPTKVSGGREQSASAEHRSDEDILRDRRHLDSYETADKYLHSASWGLWLAAVFWLFNFTTGLPTVSSLHPSATDPMLGLLACGVFCGSLSKASPRGTWSSWRIVWQVGCCVAFGCLSAAFAAAGFYADGKKTVARPAFAMSFLFCALASGAYLTRPHGPARASVPAKHTSAVTFSRTLLMGDGVAGLAIATCAIFAGQVGTAAGVAATSAATAPLLMWCVGVLCCATEAELLVAVPSAVFYLACGVVEEAVFGNAYVAMVTTVVLLLHTALYLPIGTDDDGNIFYKSLMRIIQAWTRVLSQPVSGFGDEGGGG